MTPLEVETDAAKTSTNLGPLISSFYAHFMGVYRDEELASVATAAALQELLDTPDPQEWM